MKIKYDESKEYLEKILTAFFGSIGTIAILINLAVKGFELENVLDAVKDISSLIVVVAVFLIASRLLRRKKNSDFLSVFEEHLKEWANQNKFLIDTESIESEMGKEKKRAYKMVLNHSNFVVPKATASGLGERDKGAFLYLPIRDVMGNPKQEIEFKINTTTFLNQNHFKKDGRPDLKKICEIFSARIIAEFSVLGISSVPHGEDRIKIKLENMEQTPENAKKLIDLVEFVKTMILALA